MSDISCGLTPGRKIKAAMWMSLWISLSAGVLSFIGTPLEIVQYVLAITGLGWLGAILGQAGIDVVTKWIEKQKS
jgi:hypothetical protein